MPQLTGLFSRIGVPSRLPLVVLLIHGLMAAGMICFIWGMSLPALTVPLVLAAVLWTGYRRGRPRANTDLTMVDIVFGVNAPSGMMGYHLKSLPLTFALALVVALCGM
ncbi:hypothetical protein [Corynebacterium halotolerans]|uniref:hypothetical protein n=1 Tax=Corynebacterium halotolerans TaxID=225326 RepID=UPI003CF89314